VLDTITVRQMPIEFPDEVEPDFIDGDHAQSFGLIAGSLLLLWVLTIDPSRNY
jgi:hypothetical protein